MKLRTQFILTSLSNITKQVSIFALSIILARYLTKDDYGTYLHTQLIANVAIWAFLLGIPHSIYYFLPRIREKRGFILTTLTIIIAVAMAASGVIFLCTDYLSVLLGNPRLSHFGLLLLGLVLFQIPYTVFEPLMISTKRVSTFVAVDFSFNLVFFFVVAIPVVLLVPLKNILEILILFHIIQCATIVLITLFVAKSYPKIDESADETYNIKAQVKYSAPIGLAMGVVEFSRYADKIIVSNQSSPEEYAIYARGAMDIPVISIIANTLDNLLMPRFVEAYKEGDINQLVFVWHRVIRLMATLIYPCCFFLIFSADWLIPALFSEKYAESAPIFQIYTLGLLTRISTYNVIMRSIGKTNAILWIIIFAVASNIILTYLLMQQMGLIGAPIATVITTVAVCYIYIKTITNYLTIPLSKVFPWTSLLHSLLACSLSLIPVYLISLLALSTWVHLGVTAVVFGVCYLISLRVSNALTNEDKEILREVIPSKFKWVL